MSGKGKCLVFKIQNNLEITRHLQLLTILLLENGLTVTKTGEKLTFIFSATSDLYVVLK